MPLSSTKISTLIEQQLPAFITLEYENFTRVVEKYYEHLENQGNPLDIINNITKYTDIDYYEERLLNQYTNLTAEISSSDTTIFVSDTSSFPESNGYIKVNDEICFYKEKTSNSFLYVSRGVSGNITLGDLYDSSEFVTTVAQSHKNGDLVQNVSNLFLYAIVKSFEYQYLSSFPEKYLKADIDKRTLIKNIGDFYKAKGTDKSIQFIFNSIVAREAKDVPTVYHPKDFTLKTSTADWVSTYSLKVKILSGSTQNLVGKKVVQLLDEDNSNMIYASAVIDNIIFRGTTDNEDIYEIILDPVSVNGKFEIASKTVLKKQISPSDALGKKINVFSTAGWSAKGKVLINNEVIKFNDKSINQFYIETRSSATSHAVGSKVYSYSTVSVDQTNFLILGVVYNLNPKVSSPYAVAGEKIQVSNPGFETVDPIIRDPGTNATRWAINETNAVPNSYLNSTIQSAISDIIADVSAIFEDDQYYYICSSGMPSHQFLTAAEVKIPADEKILRLIRKTPTVSTEIYETNNSDVGIFVNGTLAFGYKDEEYVSYGPIVKSNILVKGTGYKKPPYVLINNQPGKASSVLAGEVLQDVIVSTDEIFEQTPTVTVTSGRNAVVRAIVTSGKITSLVIQNPGEYYSSPPSVVISDLSGRGKFAEYKAIISLDGKLIDFEKIDEGKFYTQENVIVEIIEDARTSPSSVEVEIRKWIKNRYTRRNSSLDDNNGSLFETYSSKNSTAKSYIYGVIANPKRLRVGLGDNLSSSFVEPSTKVHSPVLGYAYDGNPIYGPFAYSDPLDSSSSIVRMQSGYNLKSVRQNGPSLSDYPLGSLVDDYQYVNSAASSKTTLDENNGRFCITPDYPNGVYAYFITINSSNTPVFPYILGKNYYSLPVDSNYNSAISQTNLPQSVKRLNTPGTQRNGDDFVGVVDFCSDGGVSSVDVQDSTNYFSVGSSLSIDNTATSGYDATAAVSSVYGKEVNSIECKQTKSLKINLAQTAYLFENDFIRQPATGAVGQLIGNVFNGNELILRNVSGSFNTTVVNADIQVINIIVDQNSSYTVNSIVELTDSINPAIATGVVLENTSNQNSLKIRVTSGTFIIDNTRFIKSSNLIDTVGSQIISISSLSRNLSVSAIDDKIAILKTTQDHNLTVGDKVSIDINPNDLTTETTYYVRNRYYQKITLAQPKITSQILDTGIGSFDLLNSGSSYTPGIYTNVELIFVNQTLARTNLGRTGDVKNSKATITVSSQGLVTSVVITSKGSGYKKGDELTVTDASLSRITPSVSTQRLRIIVDHVGFSSSNTFLFVSDITNISVDDMLKINREIVKVTAINSSQNRLTVQRAQLSTDAANHYNSEEISLYSNYYKFTPGSQPLGTAANAPFVHSYNKDSQELILKFNYTTTSPLSVVQSTSFYDSNTPAKQVRISSVSLPEYWLEMSKNNSDFDINPTLDIQKYYKYKFDTSHSSMSGVYLDFSPSISFNIVTTEKKSSIIEPGLPNSFVSLKLGFGSAISSNNYTTKKQINYTKYYYFARSLTKKINSQLAFLNIINDPIAGDKDIISVTNNRFVYKIDSYPQYDGSGSIFYTTTSRFAVGKINTVSVQNSGSNYKKLPIIKGAFVSLNNQADLRVNYNSIEKNINSITVVSQGSNYSKPIAVIVDGDGSDAAFEVVHLNGKVLNVIVKNKGKNYSYSPIIKIVESDVRLFFKSDSIGKPSSVKIISNGASFHKDSTLSSIFISNYNIFVKNHRLDSFSPGERVIQRKIINGNFEEIFSGYVAKSGWIVGSNLLKLEKISGTCDPSLSLFGTSKQNTADIVDIQYSSFKEDIRSYSNNVGSYFSEKGKIGAGSQKLLDSNFYQDYSYVIKSRTPINVWRDLIKQATHPSGFKVFGEIIVETDASGSMSSNAVSQNITYINLAPQTVTVIDTVRYLTETIISTNTLKSERGFGSISIDTYDNSETTAGEIILSAPFNGNFNPSTGQVVGTKTFNLLDKKTGLAFSPYNNQQLLVTLDGVLQEPGLSYRISGSTISFDTPPFGPRIVEGQSVEPQKFYCRSIKFKSNTFNSRYLKKLKSIDSEFDGIKKEFNLYYEDGSIVKTESNENLLVTLNGVLQKAQRQKDVPFGNSYYIKRDSSSIVTDKIVFSKPPINNDDLYDNPERQIDGAEKSFIYSIGNYTRLTIPKSLIKFKGGGPYLILDEVTNRVVRIDDPKYAFVFVDGVLQKDIESYVINGSLITFTNKLSYSISKTGEEKTADVYILLAYGRDLEKSVTVYDFEPFAYYSYTNLIVSGVNSYNQFKSYYGKKLNDPVWVYQDNSVFGKIINATPINSTDWKLTLISNNNISYDTNLPLKFTSKSNLKDVEEFSLNSISVNIEYERDLDGNRILSKETSRYYYNSSLQHLIWDETKRLISNLLPGDKIKIDGENDYREVKNIPSSVRLKNYVSNQQISSEIYAKINVSNYDGTTRGEGLSVSTRVRDGRITELLWNKRELEIYFENDILLQPTAYQYYTNPILHFIPEDENGGGAKAEVIIYNGQVIDVVLLNPGNGYTQPPRVVVARGYDVIKENRKIDTVTQISVASKFNPSMITISSTTNLYNVVSIETSFTSIPVATPQSVNATLGSTIYSFGGRVSPVGSVTSCVTQLNAGATINSINNINLIHKTRLESPVVIITTSSSVQVTTYHVGGVIDYLQAPTNNNYSYSLGKLGNTVYNFVDNLMINTGTAKVSGYSLDMLAKHIDLLTLDEYDSNRSRNYTSVTSTGQILNYGVPSINEYGSNLDSGINSTDTILYVPNTSYFPSSGTLLVGSEVVYYSGKTFSTFTGVIRGYNGTTAQSHPAGQYIRTSS